MTFSLKRQRHPMGCAICGFGEKAAIHQPPPEGPRKGSRLHSFLPKPMPHGTPVKTNDRGELNQARDVALKEIP